MIWHSPLFRHWLDYLKLSKIVTCTHIYFKFARTIFESFRFLWKFQRDYHTLGKPFAIPLFIIIMIIFFLTHPTAYFLENCNSRFSHWNYLPLHSPMPVNFSRFTPRYRLLHLHKRSSLWKIEWMPITTLPPPLFFIGVSSPKLRDADEYGVARCISLLHRRCAPYTRRGSIFAKGFAISDQACRQDIVDLPRPQFHDSHGFSFHLRGLRNRSYCQRYGCEREWKCDFRMPRHKTRSELFPSWGCAARAGRKDVWKYGRDCTLRGKICAILSIP